MHGEGAGSSSAAAAAARQGWAAAIARPLNPALQAFAKWLAAHEARIPLALCVAWVAATCLLEGMQGMLVSVAGGVLSALKAGGLVPKEPALATPLVIAALVVNMALARPGAAWIARQRAKPPPS